MKDKRAIFTNTANVELGIIEIILLRVDDALVEAVILQKFVEVFEDFKHLCFVLIVVIEVLFTGMDQLVVFFLEILVFSLQLFNVLFQKLNLFVELNTLLAVQEELHLFHVQLEVVLLTW